MSALHQQERVVVRHAARELVQAAKYRRGLLPQTSPERQFYLGVEAAAEEVARPELRMSRQPAWLERQAPAFCDGYLRTTAMIGWAETCGKAPLRFRMAEPQGTPA